jgi:membrane complex biogenesis BtpA family protein
MASRFHQLFSTPHPLIGMLHLPALPGSPHYGGSMKDVIDAALHDTQILSAAGFAGLILENLGDAPYYPDHVPAETVAAMSVVAAHVRRQTKLPVGVNVLRNDAQSAMAIAAAATLQFIRVNILIGTSVTDQGVISGQAHLVARTRQRLRTENVLIFADIRVKHAAPLVDRELAQEIDDLFERALAEAIIVSGTGSGKPVDANFLREVKKLSGDQPVLIGSGLNLENAKALLAVADGAIIGSSIKIDGQIHSRIDGARARRLMESIT